MHPLSAAAIECHIDPPPPYKRQHRQRQSPKEEPKKSSQQQRVQRRREDKNLKARNPTLKSTQHDTKKQKQKGDTTQVVSCLPLSQVRSPQIRQWRPENRPLLRMQLSNIPRPDQNPNTVQNRETPRGSRSPAKVQDAAQKIGGISVTQPHALL